MKFNSNSPIYFLPLFILLVVFASFFGAMIKNDYVVMYESECDPAVNSCFVGCEDDECTKEYYYAQIQKYAPDLYKECGPDITDCAEAGVCLPSDRECVVTYCDLENDGDVCESVSSETSTQNVESSELTGDNF